MGRVLAACDLTLGRDVALKVLLPGARADRFARESKITARLSHPGIPPVHALGTLADGSPFLAMKLVAGRTLADEMKLADRPRLLQAFLQVCQAVGFAHSRGIIHRDLKPANVMVGAFGEVQVMDWGLAKDLTGQKPQDESHPPALGTVRVVDAGPGATTAHEAAEASTDERTQAGQVMGTPAFMAPEQARGEVTDARSDVFALGGILCAILTGQPPFSGQSTREVVRRAAAADLSEAYAQLDRSGADEELLAVCRRCLSPRPDGRPADGQAVAGGLTAYLDGVQDRLRQAELAEAEAKAKAKEEAKRLRLTLALAATVLLAVLLGGGGWLYVKSERDLQQAELARRRGEVAQEVNEALGKATTLREQAKSAKTGGAALFAQAREQAQRARTLVENGAVDESLAARARALQAELDDEEKDRVFVAALDDARLAQTETAAEKRDFDFARAVPRFREAFADYGLPAGGGDPKAAAERIRRRSEAVQQAIVAALDEWVDLAGKPKNGIIEPHSEWLQAVLARVEPDDAWGQQIRAARVQADRTKARAALVKLASSADVTKVPARALTRLAEHLELQAKVELLRRAQRHHPADFWVSWDLARASLQLKPPQPDEALRFMTVAVALRPESAGAHLGLGAILCDKKRDYDGAIECFRTAIALDQKSAMAYRNLGTALQGKGNLDGAISSFRKAIELDPTYGDSYDSLGSALDDKEQYEEALANCRKAVELKPNDSRFHLTLGVVLVHLGRREEAIASFREAIKHDPQAPEANYNLGRALRITGRCAEARDAAARALPLYPTSDPRRPDVVAELERCERLAKVEVRLPRLLAGEDKPASAQEALDAADICWARNLTYAAVRFRAAAFAADPSTAEKLNSHRLSAACEAVLAAAGKGKDAGQLGEKECARLRKQALDWLRAELAALSKQLETARPADRAEVRRTLLEWLKGDGRDDDFASIRDTAALEKLPPDEQKAFAQLWADVAALLKKAEEMPN
jgi:serine/threonine-protein kinase